MLPDLVTITTQVRLAKKTDLLIAPGCLRFGQPYYLYSHRSGRFEGLYVISNMTNSEELKNWFGARMVYVPMGALDYKMKIIEEPVETKSKSA